MEQSARTKLLTGLVVVIVFGSGLAVGMAVDRPALANAAPEETVASVEEPTEQRRTPMYEQVGPTPDQKVLIDSIVRDHRGKTRTLREESRADYERRFDAIIDSTREAIKRVFTPEQAARYDSLVVEYERRQAEERAARDDN